MMMIELVDQLFLVFMAVAALWGMAALAIGGMIGLKYAFLLNRYVAEVDASFYTTASGGSLAISKRLEEEEGMGEDTELNFWPGVMAGLLVGMAGAILVYVTSGTIVVACKVKRQAMIFLTIYLILASIVVEFVVMWLVVDFKGAFHFEARASLAHKLKREYRLGATAGGFSKILNAIMIRGQCCGINGYTDFSTFNVTLGRETIAAAFSPACCENRPALVLRSASGGSGNSSGGSGNSSSETATAVADDAARAVLSACLREGGPFYTQGCYERVYEEVGGAAGALIVGAFIFMFVWQTVLAGLAVCQLFGGDRPDEDDGDEAEADEDDKSRLRRAATAAARRRRGEASEDEEGEDQQRGEGRGKGQMVMPRFRTFTHRSAGQGSQSTKNRSVETEMW